MRTNLSQANSARQQKALNQKYCFANYGIKSFLQLIDEEIIISAKEGTEPSVRYNRLKYNRMNNEQQEEYQRKLDTKVKIYKLYTSNGSCFTAPKMVYEYFKERERTLKTQLV